MSASQKALQLVQAYTGAATVNSTQDIKSVASSKPEILGSTAEEKTQVDTWLSWSEKNVNAAGSNVNEALQALDNHLRNSTYIAGNNLTVADLVTFADLHSHAGKITVASTPNVLRWVDLVQNTVVKGNSIAEKEFPLISVDHDNVPEPVITVAKKEKKGEAKVETAVKETSAAVVDGVVPEKKKEKAKKEKKEKAPPAPAAPEQHVVSRLDIRVGHIVSCKKHEDADALYVEQIDVGDPEGVPRTIVSGLVKWYPLEEMQNRTVLVLCNLKPANMRGVKSQGMVLCASPADGTKVELLAPVDLTKVKPGDRVYFEGMEGTPENVLNPKKKYWETVQPDFKTNGETFAFYQDKPFLIKSSSGEDVKVKAASVTEGLIR
ncbi:G4 quadruplex nucleic acid binding protein [Umbelopsis nana]